MKKISIGLIALLSINIAFISCQKEEIMKEEFTQLTTPTKAAPVDFPSANHMETWDPSTKTCAPPANDCVVVTPDIASHKEYANFEKAVDNNTIIEFYEKGPGQDVLPLSPNAYSDLVSKKRTLYKVTTPRGETKYALY